MEPQNENQTSTAKKTPNISIPAAIVTGAAIIGLAIILSGGSKESPGGNNQPATANDTTPTTIAGDIATVRAQDYVRGNANAEVVVIEYSDSDCPFCKQFHDTMNQALSAYKGKVSWVYRFFPLETLHPNAFTEAVSLYCVGELGGDSAFWSYLDNIIGVTLNADAKSNEALVTFAKQSGVDSAMLKTCMASPVAKASVTAGIDEAKKIGARGTPFSIAVNTKTGKQIVIPGAVPLDYLKKEIDSLLK